MPFIHSEVTNSAFEHSFNKKLLNTSYVSDGLKLILFIQAKLQVEFLALTEKDLLGHHSVLTRVPNNLITWDNSDYKCWRLQPTKPLIWYLYEQCFKLFINSNVLILPKARGSIIIIIILFERCGNWVSKGEVWPWPRSESLQAANSRFCTAQLQSPCPHV